MATMNFHTINALPPDERVHALFLGYREGTYGFEVTGIGTVGIPQNHIRRVGNLCHVLKGEDLNLKRVCDWGLDDDGYVMIWRVQ